MTKTVKIVLFIVILILIGFVPVKTEKVLGLSSVLLSYKNEKCSNPVKSMCKKKYTNNEFTIFLPMDTEQNLVSVKYRRQIQHSFFLSYGKYCVVSYQDLQTKKIEEECLELEHND